MGIDKRLVKLWKENRHPERGGYRISDGKTGHRGQGNSTKQYALRTVFQVERSLTAPLFFVLYEVEKSVGESFIS